MAAKKPAEIAREKLAKRARQQIALTSGTVPKELRKTPSQKHSENTRRKYAIRDGTKYIQTHYPCDCWKCPMEPCGRTLEVCEQRSMVHRCKQCGHAVRHRIEPGKPWEYCPVCIVQVKQ